MERTVEDYPRILAELEVRFSSEEAWQEYLFRLRWPEAFRCSRCGESKTWPLRSGRWQCAGCGHQVSVTAGTIFQGTRTPLTCGTAVITVCIQCGILGRRAVNPGYSLPSPQVAGISASVHYVAASWKPSGLVQFG